MKSNTEEAERVEVKSLAELHDWLQANHTRQKPVWLVTYKKHSPHYVSIGESVDELLSFGWIDSRMHRVDEDRMERWISPRRPDSIWSLPNKARVEKLRTAGRMMPSGERAVAVAVENGMWEFLEEIEAQIVPDDLARAFKNADVTDGWDRLADSERKRLLYWIKSAKTEKTRAKRVAACVDVALGGDFPGNGP